VARRLLEVLNKAAQGCVLTPGHEEMEVIWHEAVRNDLEPTLGGARRQTLEAGGNEAPVLKRRQSTASVEDQVVRVAPLVAEGVKSRR